MVKVTVQGFLAAVGIGTACGARIQIHDQEQAAEPYCANSDGITGYGFSHLGAWDDFVSDGQCTDAQCCADTCSVAADCVAFAHSTTTRLCYTFQGSLGATTNSGSVSSFRAYWRCGGGGTVMVPNFPTSTSPAAERTAGWDATALPLLPAWCPARLGTSA